MWVECSKQQPPKGGMYRVIRRPARSSQTHYYDYCHWTPPINAGEGYWSTQRGTIIKTVVWWEKEE